MNIRGLVIGLLAAIFMACLLSACGNTKIVRGDPIYESDLSSTAVALLKDEAKLHSTKEHPVTYHQAADLVDPSVPQNVDRPHSGKVVGFSYAPNVVSCKPIPDNMTLAEAGITLPTGWIETPETRANFCMPPTWQDDVQLAATAQLWTEQHTVEVPIWKCTIADWGTTAVGIIKFGLVEANPLGVVGSIAWAVVVNKSAENAGTTGDTTLAYAAAYSHCGAAAWNVAMMAL